MFHKEIIKKHLNEKVFSNIAINVSHIWVSYKY